jgi:hypothetical protein
MRIVMGALMCVVAASVSAQGRYSSTERPSARLQESPFACDRSALSPAQRARHFDELGPTLRSMKTGVRELPDGYAFAFPSDPKSVALIAEWAAGERACCPFFDIDVRMEREHGPVWLTLTGRPGTKDFVAMDFAGWFKH